MPDREPPRTKGEEGLILTPKKKTRRTKTEAQGYTNGLSGADLGPQTSDSGAGEDKPNALLTPQLPNFDQNLLQAIRNNQNAEKLSLTDARLINKFLRENDVEQKEYRKMDAKTKVSTAADKVDLRIDSYIKDADAFAKKKVEERGFTPRENFDSPFGPNDPFTVESQKKAIRNRLLSQEQGDSVQPGTLEAVYLREEAIGVAEKWLRSNQFPDLYTLWAKTPENIIIECGLSAQIDDLEKEKILKEEDQPVPFRDMDQYAQDIRDSETSFQNEIISGDSESKITSFAKVIEARKHIRKATVDPRDPLYIADAKLKDTFRLLSNRRILVERPNGKGEEICPDIGEEKTTKSKRLKQLIIVGGALGIGVIVASLCLSGGKNGNDDNRQVSSNQATPTISADRANVLTAQAEFANKKTATAEIAGSVTPTITAPEPTQTPITPPVENPQNPVVPPPVQPQAHLRSSDYNHDQATEIMDLTDGVKDGFVSTVINEPGTNFDNAQAQTLKPTGLNLINKANLYENGAERWRYTLLSSDGDGDKYRLVHVDDRIQIPAEKYADAYRWSNVEVPDGIASQVKLVSTQEETKNDSMVTEYKGHQQPQTANEKPEQPTTDFSMSQDSITDNQLGSEIDIKTFIQNNEMEAKNNRGKQEISKNINNSNVLTHPIIESPVLATPTKKLSVNSYNPTSYLRDIRNDDHLKFIAAVLYQRESQKLKKKFRLNLSTTKDDNEKEDFYLLANL